MIYSFNNDYSEGAHPNILKAMMETNLEQNAGYSMDLHTENAKKLIKKEIKREDVDIHCIVGGTQTNTIVIAAALKPYQAVIAVHTGHINVHETGAIEASGHKVIAVSSPDGKMTTAMIAGVLDTHTDEHMVDPKMVYISNSTEIGTQYTKVELEKLSSFCKQKNLYLFMDGARLGSALTSKANDLTMEDIAALTDVFYIGGTKNGALFGEALVIVNDDLKENFRYMIKQRGAMLAKGWLLGIQFEELFKNNLFYDMAKHANDMAGKLRKGIQELGYSFASASVTNQIFAVFPDQVIKELEKDFLFSVNGKPDEKHTEIRLVTSWATKEEGVLKFLEKLSALSGR